MNQLRNAFEIADMLLCDLGQTKTSHSSQILTNIYDRGTFYDVLYIFDSVMDRMEKNSPQLAQFDIYVQDKVRIYIRRKDENDSWGEMAEI